MFPVIFVLFFYRNGGKSRANKKKSNEKETPLNTVHFIEFRRVVKRGVNFGRKDNWDGLQLRED